MSDKKKEPEYVLDRSQFDNDELSEIDRIKDILDVAEIVRAVARQSKVMPGHKLITPKTIFVTDKRVIIREPKMLGLSSAVDVIPFSQINHVKLKKGAFTSEIKIESGQFESDDASDNRGLISAIPKDKAAKIVGIINEGIRRAQTHVTETSQTNSIDDALSILKKRLARGDITKEQYEDLKKTLE